MGSDDERYYETLYGFYPYDWDIDFGTFADHHYLLDREYIDEGCITLDYSEASVVHKFVYPHFFKRLYWIEGVIKGQITLSTIGATSTVTSYRVTICKMHADTTDTELISTGWITVNDTLAWDSGPSVGDEIVYPFWIDCLEEKEVSENERIYVKVEVECTSPCVLYHTNGGEFTDLKVEIPIRG